MTIMQKEQIKVLRGEGLSYLEIADKIGIPKNTVKSFCRRNAIEAVTTSEETKNEDYNDYKEEYLQCLQCGQHMNKVRSTKKFCSDICRFNYHKVNRKPSAVCTNCGEMFDNNGNQKRKYCSTACYITVRFPESPKDNEVEI